MRRLYSNGDYLNNELLKELVNAGLDNLFVTAYNERKLIRLKKVYALANVQERKVLSIRRAPLFVGNRAGSLDNTIVREPLGADCFMPSYQLAINYKGEVVLCCNDYYGKVVLGNVKNDSLLSIWKGDGFKEIRVMLRKKSRSQLELCSKCNLLRTPWYSKYLTCSEILIYNKKGKCPALRLEINT